MKKIAVLFSGTGSNLAYLLKNLHKQNSFEIVVALSNKKDAGGIAFAKEYSIPLEIIPSKEFTHREAFDTKVVEVLEEYSPDLTVLAGFMRILTPTFTEQIRAINLHPSLLPRHKGLLAIERSYEDNHPTGGVSVHWVTSELDGGEIILQKEIQKAGLSFEEYEEQIKVIEKVALLEAIESIFD